MSAATIDPVSSRSLVSTRIARKVWREVARPVRRLAHRAGGVDMPHVPGAGAGIANFHSQQATVEPEGLVLLQRLVRESRRYTGPIVEIGTLLGITATQMALAKAPEQKIITVDLYCWNPWGLTPEVHENLTSQMLCYLVQTGHVEQVCMDKDEFYQSYAGPAPALVFLDAMHDYENTKRDIEWARSAGAKIICGHDYSHLHPGVIQIVDELGGPRELAGSVWVL
jgi:hypothetical protein